MAGERRVGRGVRRFVLTAAVLAAATGLLTGCGMLGVLGRGQECPAIGFRQGIGIDIQPPLAKNVASASFEICWSGKCRTADVVLNETRDTIAEPCEGKDADAVCSATVGPANGGLYGFADVADLPGRPVQLTVELRSAAGEVVLDKQLTVTPKEPKPDANGCNPGAGRFQTGVIVTGNGSLRER